MKNLFIMICVLCMVCITGDVFAKEKWQCAVYHYKYTETKHGKKQVWDWLVRKRGNSVQEALRHIEKHIVASEHICRVEDVLNDNSIKEIPELPQQLGWLIKNPNKKMKDPNWVFLDDQSVTNYFGTFQELSEANPYPTPVSLCFYVCSPASPKFEFLGFGY